MGGNGVTKPRCERSGAMILFECPGCEYSHGVHVEPEGKYPVWKWNGSLDRPTFYPSILVRSNVGDPPRDTVCHSFVTDGRIQFLGDCTHALAGQTVYLPVIEA